VPKRVGGSECVQSGLRYKVSVNECEEGGGGRAGVRGSARGREKPNTGREGVEGGAGDEGGGKGGGGGGGGERV